ncbi:MAG: BA14K family protein [Brucellaceae bacterium]|nr:BA14K family protein [Brucellaceae bacterium]
MAMKSLISCAVAIAAAFSAVSPAASLPLSAPAVSAPAETGDVVNVQYGRRGFYLNGGYGWYNGHRGYRYQRPGWRYHNGWWFPPAAFALGVIIGNQLTHPGYNAPPRRHYNWCYANHPNYRQSDNTYWQYGKRRICRSPYWG